jgi:mannitol/fructose-specific phosphotransferase system IIA component (Ntr-type)
MQLCLYLTPESIAAPLKGEKKDDIIRELVERLTLQHGISNSDNVLTAVMEREGTSSTFLPSGIAIPHARVPDASDIVVAFGVAPKPINDNTTSDGLTARIFCLFLSPTRDKEFGRHLKLLARISAIFSDPEFIEQISNMTDSKEIFEALQKRERTLDQE